MLFRFENISARHTGRALRLRYVVGRGLVSRREGSRIFVAGFVLASLFEGGGFRRSRKTEGVLAKKTPSVRFADSSLGEGA